MSVDDQFRIIGLPDGLDVVPHHRAGYPNWRKEYGEWTVEVDRYRKDIRAVCRDDKEAQRDELVLCSTSRMYWATIWGVVEESRAQKGLAPVRPFTPYPYQVQMAHWFDDILYNDDFPDDGYISKSRGLGISWNICFIGVHGWIWSEPWDPYFTSRVEDLVDKPRNKHSLFYKMDFIRERLPPWMCPTLEPKVDRQHLVIRNPLNGNTLLGGSTNKQAGVAGRATFFWYDELGRVKDAAMMHDAGSGTTDHRIACSTETFEMGMEWWNMWQSAKKADARAVLELDYWLKPEWGEDWEVRERKRWIAKGNPDGFMQEYGRDPLAAEGGLVYSFAREAPNVEKGYDDQEDIIVGYDPGRRDATAFVLAQTDNDVHGNTTLRWFDSYERVAMPAEFFAHILTGEPPIEGDQSYGFFNQRDTFALQTFAKFPWDRIRWFADPHIAHQETATGLSSLRIIMAKSEELRDRQIKRWKEGKTADMPEWVRRRLAVRGSLPWAEPIVFLYAWDKRDFEARRNAMRATLLRSTFSAGSGGASRIRTALSMHRFNKSGMGHEHGEGSNIVSACEYVAVHVSVGLHLDQQTQEEAKAAPARYDLAMNPV